MYSSLNTVKFDTSDAHDKYTCSICNLFCGTVRVPVLYLYQTFQELPDLNGYLTNSGEKLFIDLRRRKGYAGALEKINRNDDDLMVTVRLKATTTKKMRLRVNWTLPG